MNNSNKVNKTNNFNNKQSEFQRITRLIPLEGGQIDWSAIEKTSLALTLSQMARTNQSPKYHGEIDVLTHTKMVCEEMIRQPEYINGSLNDKIVLFWAALLHDIGKITCTVMINGELKNPYHATKGASMARALLWRELGLCGSVEAQAMRESICLLIRYHSFPPYAATYKDAEFRLLKMAANGELAPYFSIRGLCALERADMLGRIYSGIEDSLEKIEWCKALAEEAECFTEPYKFTNDFSQRAYFLGKTAWKNHDMFNDSWGKVILMSGLAGTGKDTYVAKYYSDIPVVALDDVRHELKALPTDNQGKVIALAKERAREYLRKKQPFVWNATNLTTMLRDSLISLFEEYGASVEIVFLETEWAEQHRRNSSRSRVVADATIDNMLERLNIPERYESERVLWKIV